MEKSYQYLGIKNLVVEDLSSYLVAIGTIALAIATFVLVFESRSQLKLLRSQSIIQKYNTKPHLIIKQFSVNKNAITITLKNIGNGIAKEIGLVTTFNPMFKQNENYHLIPNNKFEYEGKVMKSVESGTNLKPNNNSSNILDKNEEQVFITNTLYFELKEDIGMFGTRQFLTIEKLIEFLKTQKVPAFAFSIDLLYRDLSAEVVSSYHYLNLIFDINKHQSLEDSFNDKLTPYGLPISYEKAQEIGFFDVEFYRNLKTE